MKDVLVTGGAGFIGSHLCEQLIHLGYNVTCIDNLSTGRLDNIAHLPSLRFIESDVNDNSVFRQLRREKFDALFHYAAVVGVRRTEENPHLVLADSHGLQNIAEFARQGNAKKIIFASSSEVYGDSGQQPLHEDYGYNACTPYSAVKIYGEHLFRSLWIDKAIPTVSLRFFNVYGPRQIGNAYGFVIAKFIRQVLAGKPPTIFGDGEQTRDFVYIQDNIAAAIKAMDQSQVYGLALNIGTGSEVSIIDLARAIIEAAGQSGQLEPVFKKERTYEIYRRCADVTRMNILLDFTCGTKLQQGLAYLIEYEVEKIQPQKASIPISPQPEALAP